MFDEMHVHVYRDGKLVKTFNKRAIDGYILGHEYSQLALEVAQLAVTLNGRVAVSAYGRRYRTDSFDTIEYLTKILDMPRPWTTDQVARTIFSVIQHLVFRAPKAVS